MIEQDGEAGFSTLEALIAFVVLSFGLAVSVQSISQASLAERNASARSEAARLLRNIVTEELPSILDDYPGGTQTHVGPSWRIELQPTMVSGKPAAVRAMVQLTDANGQELPYSHMEIVPLADGTR
jgi:hypothetical protein